MLGISLVLAATEHILAANFIGFFFLTSHIGLLYSLVFLSNNFATMRKSEHPQIMEDLSKLKV